jgi:hypothetical protein
MATGARSVVLALIGLALSACSLANPSAHTFTSSNSATAAAADSQTADASAPKAKHGKHKKGGKGGKGDKGDAPLQPIDPASALAAAEKFCRDTARDKGIKSVLSILTHLRPGAYDEEYVACMKSKGYQVAQ